MSQIKVSKDLAKKFLTQKVIYGTELISQAQNVVEKVRGWINSREDILRRVAEKRKAHLPLSYIELTEPRNPRTYRAGAELPDLKEAYENWIDDIIEECDLIYSEPQKYQSYFSHNLVLNYFCNDFSSLTEFLSHQSSYDWNAYEKDLLAFIEIIKKTMARLVRMQDLLELYPPPQVDSSSLSDFQN
ncbi:MAG: hypothetical protein HYR94_18720 [Chloroflexi bacterium]|nr:hypothetical protein [Chloroflexota bacterium]